MVDKSKRIVIKGGIKNENLIVSDDFQNRFLKRVNTFEQYEIKNIPVLTKTALGSGVKHSQLTSVGILDKLEVANTIFLGPLKINVKSTGIQYVNNKSNNSVIEMNGIKLKVGNNEISDCIRTGCPIRAPGIIDGAFTLIDKKTLGPSIKKSYLTSFGIVPIMNLNEIKSQNNKFKLNNFTFDKNSINFDGFEISSNKLETNKKLLTLKTNESIVFENNTKRLLSITDDGIFLPNRSTINLGNSEVLAVNRLGSTVTESSLESFGTVRELKVKKIISIPTIITTPLFSISNGIHGEIKRFYCDVDSIITGDDFKINVPKYTVLSIQFIFGKWRRMM